LEIRSVRDAIAIANDFRRDNNAITIANANDFRRDNNAITIANANEDQGSDKPNTNKN
jgi:hypothetical protein